MPCHPGFFGNLLPRTTLQVLGSCQEILNKLNEPTYCFSSATREIAIRTQKFLIIFNVCVTSTNQGASFGLLKIGRRVSSFP